MGKEGELGAFRARLADEALEEHVRTHVLLVHWHEGIVDNGCSDERNLIAITEELAIHQEVAGGDKS